jgi:hypothetical protein
VYFCVLVKVVLYLGFHLLLISWVHMSYYHQQKPRDCKGNIRQIKGSGRRNYDELGLTSWVWRLTYPTVSHCFKFVLSFWSRSCLINCCVSSWCLFPILLFEASHIKVHWQQWLSTWSSSKMFHWGWKLFKVYQPKRKGGSSFLSPVLKKFPDWMDMIRWFELIELSKLN